MQPITPRSTHGGRRAGAGAPIGNVNAMKSARNSRLSFAYLMLLVTPGLRHYADAVSPGSGPVSRQDRELYRRLLESCHWVIENHPELPGEVLELVQSRVASRLHEVANRAVLLALLRVVPRDDYKHVERAIYLAGWAYLNDPGISEELGAYLHDLISQAPCYPPEAPRKPESQSNNQDEAPGAPRMAEC